MPKIDTTLVLFCKPPSRSKQRLVPELGARATRELAERLLACALEDAAAWRGPVVLSPAEPADRDWARGLGLAAADVVVQAGGNLGGRLNDIDSRLRDEGHGKLLFIGADCPLLDRTALETAAADLEAADVALGEAEDGGVVYMGNSRPWPDLTALPWSTARLADALAGACRRAGLGVASRGRWPDVDRSSDLPGLARALAGDDRAARQRLRHWLLADDDAANGKVR
jgi:hypothetical protein